MMLNHVTVKLRAQANVDFHFKGHCVFRKLLETEQLLIDAKNAFYHKIFNKFENEQETPEDIRMAAKASSNGEKAIQDIFKLLQHCMIVGEVIDTIFPPHRRAPVLRATSAAVLCWTERIEARRSLMLVIRSCILFAACWR